MTTRGFHNVQVSVSLQRILPIPIFRVMSNISHLPIADTTISVSLQKILFHSCSIVSLLWLEIKLIYTAFSQGVLIESCYLKIAIPGFFLGGLRGGISPPLKMVLPPLSLDLRGFQCNFHMLKRGMQQSTLILILCILALTYAPPPLFLETLVWRPWKFFLKKTMNTYKLHFIWDHVYVNYT